MAVEHHQQPRRSRWRAFSISQEPDRPLTTVNVLAAQIDPKLANLLIRELNAKAPLTSLTHLKRVRKRVSEDGVELSIILCRAAEDSKCTHWKIPDEFSELVATYGLRPFVAVVPEKPARTKEEWEAQCQYWPTSFHPSKDTSMNLDEDELIAMNSFMEEAVRQAQLASSNGQFANGAIIVDPASGTVIASGFDVTCAWQSAFCDCNAEKIREHLDEHGAAVTCSSTEYLSPSLDEDLVVKSCRSENSQQTTQFNNKTEKDFSKFKATNMRENFGEMALEHPSSAGLDAENDTAVFQQLPKNSEWDELSTKGSDKGTSFQFSVSKWHPLQHAVISAIETASRRDKRLFPSAINATAKGGPNNFQDSLGSKRQRVEEEMEHNSIERKNGLSGQHAPLDVEWHSRPYLCTGFDLYVTREPCTMCAMAMVHQRVRRVIYGLSNRVDGALGGLHRLHGLSSLNHHYAVFRLNLQEEDLLWHSCSANLKISDH